AEDANIRKALRDVCKSQGFSARVSPILHDIADVNANLSDGRYFFLDIKREGRLLYDAGCVELAEPRELTPVEAQRIAQGDFDRWFNCANAFYDGCQFYADKGQLPLAAFQLNQASEAAYKCILLVFTGYCPHEHLLEWLGERAALYGPVYRELFPQLGEKEKKRFELLDKAYIGARYKKAFPVFPGDIDYLAPRVKRLLELTESLCREEIERIGREGVRP
ncbi:hypothetical protein CAI21_18640, partial [Alkalilimnicola ehrlichii]